MRVRTLFVAAAIVVGTVTPAALARGTSELGAVRAEYQKTALLEYFGPTSALCAQFTPADRRVFSHAFWHPTTTCKRAARNVRQLLRACPSVGGFTAARWRRGVMASMALVKVRILSPTAARVTDPLYEHDTVVRTGHGWRFSRGWPEIEC